MEKLLMPNTGLMIWTVVTFVVVLLVLRKFAWAPILEGIDSRERKIREDLARAEKANAEAAALRQQYDAQIVAAQKEMQALLSKARADAERSRGELVTAAKAEADRIVEKGRKDLAGETDRLRAELRQEVAALSMEVAEKIIQKSIDKKVADDLVAEAVRSVGGAKK